MAPAASIHVDATCAQTDSVGTPAPPHLAPIPPLVLLRSPLDLGAALAGKRRSLVTTPPLQQRQHLPLRPLWICRICAAPWPCAPARLSLRRKYAHDLVSLAIYLSTVLHEAAADLYRLSPNPAPTRRIFSPGSSAGLVVVLLTYCREVVNRLGRTPSMMWRHRL